MIKTRQKTVTRMDFPMAHCHFNQSGLTRIYWGSKLHDMTSFFRRSSPRFFLTRSETAQLMARIAQFEKSAGCELVFHFRRKLGPQPEKANQELFHPFGLDKTSDRRAVLVTLALREKQFAIWADDGVEKHAGRALHDEIARHLKAHLPEERHLQALLGVVDIAESRLKGTATGHHQGNEIPNKPVIE